MRGKRATVSNMPIRYDQKFGEMNFHGGEYKGKALISWDIVNSCAEEACPVFDRCPSLNKKADHKCLIQLKYAKTTANVLLKAYGEQWDQLQVYGFGMHLTPLFVQLSKLKIIEAGLGINDIVCVGKSKYIHPIFKEIRETMKVIYTVYEKLGMDFKSRLMLSELLNKEGDKLLDPNDCTDYVTELMKGTESDLSETDIHSLNFVAPMKRKKK